MNSALKFPQQGSFSVVTPVYNCEASVAELRRRLDEVLPRIATTGRFQCAVRFFKLDFHDTGSACFRHADRVQHSAIAACEFHQVYLNLFGISMLIYVFVRYRVEGTVPGFPFFDLQE